MSTKIQTGELKHKVLIALIEKGVFSVDNNPRVTKFQGGKFHLKSDDDSGKAVLKDGIIEFDTIKFGSGKTEIIENRNSDNPEILKLIDEYGIDNKKMESSIFVFDKEAGEIKEFKMKKSFNKMNNGIKAMQVQRVMHHIKETDLILNTNLDRYIK